MDAPFLDQSAMDGYALNIGEDQYAINYSEVQQVALIHCS